MDDSEEVIATVSVGCTRTAEVGENEVSERKLHFGHVLETENNANETRADLVIDEALKVEDENLGQLG